jgi:hypothetical protein
MIARLMAAATLLAPVPALAEMREAVSTNFVVVSDESEAALRDRVGNLEKFGGVLQAITGARRPKHAPVKVKIHVVRTMRDVGESMPFGGGAAGYYSAPVRGPFAVTPRYSGQQGPAPLEPLTVLQHELGHHFMYQYFPVAYPTWYSEGFADYVGVIRIDKNVATLGLPVENRYLGLRFDLWLPMRKILTAKSYADLGGNLLAVYSQGWLLVHYLNSTAEGKAKLGKYLRAINAGVSFDKAAEELGDLDSLDKQLRSYAQKDRIQGTAINFVNLDAGPITIRVLRPEEEALRDADLALSSGIPKARAATFAAEVARTAARFPETAYSLRIRTEAERLAGNREVAITLADRWIAADPGNGLAHLHRGMIEIERLKVSRSTNTVAWEAARSHLATARKLAPQNPEVLFGFYRGYAAEGRLPPVIAQNALMAALDNLPQNGDLRMAATLDFEQRGMILDAIETLAPLVNDVRDEKELDPKEKARRDKLKIKYALAGDDDVDEPTPHEVLARLRSKLPQPATE